MTTTVIEIIGESTREDSRNQRWSNLLTLGFIVLGLAVGVYLRDSTLYATTIFINNEVGIRAEYPAGWLIDFDGDYVFRVRDMSRVGFKTTIEVSVRPFSADMDARNVFDSLSFERSQRSTYSEIDRRAFVMPDDEVANLSEYSYVFTESDPFLAPLPVVVLGQDILVIRRGQAILITFVTDADTFEQDYPIFERFLASLEI